MSVMCRICRKRFDKEKLVEGVDWINPVKNMYYHKKCHDDWKTEHGDVTANKADEEYIDCIYSFLSQDLKVKYDYIKCESQRKNFIKSKGYTNKGICFALKYYYEVKNNSWDKAQGGIGVVPYIYAESREYWTELNSRQENIVEQIAAQMKARADRPTITITKQKKQKPQWEPHWDEIEASEDE